jgi:hypothetical protein
MFPPVIRRSIWLALAALVLSVHLPVRADEERPAESTEESANRWSRLKQGVKDTAHRVGEGARSAGHAVRDGAREVGHKVGEAGQKVGEGAKNTAKAVGHGAKETGHEVKSAVKGDDE